MKQANSGTVRTLPHTIADWYAKKGQHIFQRLHMKQKTNIPRDSSRHVSTKSNRVNDDNNRPNRLTLLGIGVDPLTMDETIEQINTYVRHRHFAHVIGVNADKTLTIRRDPFMAKTVANCEVVNADGISMILAGRILNVKLPERVPGIDLMIRLCELADKNEYRVYLVGARPEIAAETRKRLRRTFPHMVVVGTRDGYFDEAKYEKISTEIEAMNPDIVFVGITSPKKEEFIEACRRNNARAVYLGVGGSFDVLSGKVARAPRWIQRLGIEWLFRLVQEPRRLFKRYFFGNIQFGIIVFQEFLKGYRK